MQSLQGQVAEVRAEQRAVLKELGAEQARVLGEVKLDQAIVREKLDANTALSQVVRVILTTFKTVGSFAKWLGYIAAALGSATAAVVGAWVAIKSLR
jgi:hypothetical protein